MAHAVRFYETGGPEVLRYEQVQVGDPGPGQVRVRHVAVGLNFADTYFRLGYYPVPVPNGMGVEASGVIEAVGDNVNGFTIGDRVTYTGSPLGAYSTDRVMPAASLIKLPVDIDHKTAAASTMRGLSAAYWLLKTNPWMKAGDTILLHAAAGGVGLIAVSGPSCSAFASSARFDRGKGRIAKGYGCDEIIYYRREDVPERVMELTGGKGVTTVYDTVGKDTFEGIAEVAEARGVLVGCGTASGPFPPIDALQMAIQGSVYFTRPALADYIADPGRAPGAFRKRCSAISPAADQDRNQPALRA
jgi:NADPH2:quinone reductase